MIVQCPSCNARFSIDASKIQSSLSKGRCSLCGQVFPVLDHAVDQLEATEIRDRLEEERAERARRAVGDVTGMYGVTQKREEEESLFFHPETALEEAEEMAEGEFQEKIGILKDMEEGPEESEGEDLFSLEEESNEFEGIETVLGDEEKEEKEALEEIQETEEEYTFSGIEGEESFVEELVEKEEDFEFESTGEEVAEWPPAGEVMEEELIRDHKEEGVIEREEERSVGEGIESESDESDSEESQESVETDSSKEESLISFHKEKKSSSIPTPLIVVLVVLVLAVGGWYFFRSEATNIVTKVTKKISEIRGQSALVIFNLKNEQEAASDGKFFAVRGIVQNKQKTPFPFITLKIKIYDAKSNVILTKQTIAGRVLKADEISKMTVQDVLKQFAAMNDMNRKSAGKLAPKQKLPFLFLFDLSKFPRKRAKTFQVEILKPSK